MPRVATFCPRCGESIDTQLPEEARTAGRAELTCPSCRFRFVIAPASSSKGDGPTSSAAAAAGPEGGPDEPTAESGREPAATPSPTSPPPAEEDPASQPAPLPQASQAHAVKKGPSGALPARLLSAALLLFFAAAAGLFFAIVFSNAPGIFAEQLDGPPGSGSLEGVVLGPDRDGLEGVTVELMAPVEEGRPDAETESVAQATTDSQGQYEFENIDPGERWLRVDHDGYQLTFFKVWVFSGQSTQPGFGAALWEVTLRAGDGEEPSYQTQQVGMLDLMLQVFQVWGYVAYPASAIAGLGGVFTLMRRSFPIAVIGAVAGILAFGFLIGAVLAVVAMILVLTARREFSPLRRPKPDETGGQ